MTSAQIAVSIPGFGVHWVYPTLTVLVGAIMVWPWVMENHRHTKVLDRLDVRIHVNGIRGKSSVSRLIAAMLRENGYTTIGKTTGSAAVMIDRHGVDHPIVRTGPPTILEQIEIIADNCDEDVNALVIECMAIRPEYAFAAETRIVRSHIGVITNVREDHQDVFGPSLEEIARGLANTTPRDGLMITSERREYLQDILAQKSKDMGSRFIVSDDTLVTDEDLAGFSYIEFEDNIAIGLVIADELGISRDDAMRGMQLAPPDPGALEVIHAELRGKDVTWANLFAVNDRESTIFVMDRLKTFHRDDTTVVAVLNNRADRAVRVNQFADIVSLDVEVDYAVTWGYYEQLATARLLANRFDPDRIINLGNDTEPSLDEILDRMIGDMASQHVLIVGLVNIHTEQATQWLHLFDQIKADQGLDDGRSHHIGH